jgi:hypothetical protein
MTAKGFAAWLSAVAIACIGPESVFFGASMGKTVTSMMPEPG